MTRVTFARDTDQYVFGALAKTLAALFFASKPDENCSSNRLALQLIDTTTLRRTTTA
ncbi:hypothetical protein SBA1_470069 [Candidatus Sulfotelmatobacter kueseliae]|uniref:Uncharacterized protein n=1 Tax=Candidatus Sulfotelmatobacter kueseliae TaxID=2042962 RepID=A0A2U3KTD4_9BACT|nr:hypothetical protein SBA1_470069 [Candidatus Sulfotelmatobacter kueseliae]